MENQDAVVAEKGAAVLAKQEAFDNAQKGIDEAIAAGTAKPSNIDTSKYKVFVAVAAGNTKFIIKPGPISKIKDPNSPTGERDMYRTGDKVLQFTDGIAVLTVGEDDDAIAWAYSRPDICRDIADPKTEAWAYFKDAQRPRANREAILPEGVDVDAVIDGRAGVSSQHTTVERARARAASQE